MVRVRSIVDQLRTDPAMAPVVLFEHLKSMLEADPNNQVTAELRRLLEQPSAAGQLGLPLDAGGDRIRAAAQQKLQWAHGQALSTLTAAEDAALPVLIGAYSRLAR